MNNYRKKIGILTFQNAINYGAVLQAYALQNCLKEDYEVEIIDYLCEKKALKCKKNLKQVVATLLCPRYTMDKKNQVRKFKDFMDLYVDKSTTYNQNTIIRANDCFDAFVAGSDQIWNLRITNNDLNYFLDFADQEKKFSYAASFGGDPCLFDENRKYFVESLSTFKSLLIREKDGIDYLKRIGFAGAPKLVCDPVFLIKKDLWINGLGLQIKEKNYVFLYIVAKDDKAITFAKHLAEHEDLKIVINQLYKGKKAYVRGTTPAMDIGPKEFLELIMNAKYVVTTSFHAMALSLIFNVDFYYELSHDTNNKNSRLQNIASIFEVQNREIIDMNTQRASVNWKQINETIDSYSSESKSLLFESLQAIK